LHSLFFLPASAWRQLAHPLKLLKVQLAQRQRPLRPPQLQVAQAVRELVQVPLAQRQVVSVRVSPLRL
jgi:hypothetical protein